MPTFAVNGTNQEDAYLNSVNTAFANMAPQAGGAFDIAPVAAGMNATAASIARGGSGFLW
ncbi:hypothetical protein [Methylobacterium planeticum]|uniref:Uncharacterized protein n=1 Tax=Methylobacterium planeticum TaxID=2615211 RepID=A0A6N6MS61_9HYPH|nr:hypothetical protein [Methylobacterium planeticum]KAB1072185.1 hypothetical protein F6X51_17335 [Methylobacterium planeticum]